METDKKAPEQAKVMAPGAAAVLPVTDKTNGPRRGVPVSSEVTNP